MHSSSGNFLSWKVTENKKCDEATYCLCSLNCKVKPEKIRLWVTGTLLRDYAKPIIIRNGRKNVATNSKGRQRLNSLSDI